MAMLCSTVPVSVQLCSGPWAPLCWRPAVPARLGMGVVRLAFVQDAEGSPSKSAPPGTSEVGVRSRTVLANLNMCPEAMQGAHRWAELSALLRAPSFEIDAVAGR